MGEDRLITVHSEDLDIAVPITQVREVIPVDEVFPVPGSREPFLGLMIYRNRSVLPVFSLAGLLGRGSVRPGALVVVAEVNRSLFGLPVQRIGGVLQGSQDVDRGEEAAEGIEEHPPVAAVRGTVIVGGRRHLVLDLARFFH